jgi:glutamate-1-semialdehyde 2,1-aminomutase
VSFRFNTQQSQGLVARLRRVLPGGDTRSITYFAPYPLGIDRGEGYRLWDVDGNEFLDLLNNYTALVHGHAHPAIVAAIGQQSPRGTAFPAPHVLQAELAERICARFDSVERVRFTNSGSEADMVAIRAARAYTGRDEIVKADGGYHGLWEQVPMSWNRQHGQAGDSGGGEGETWDAAIPEAVRALVHMIDYNDVEQLEVVMRDRGERVACLIFEPVLGEGVIAGAPGFFRRARELADEYGALLVIDEVVTARLRYGGYQSELGVSPDLTVFGKIIGGGLPVGAVGGSAEVMEIFDPRRQQYLAHAGTFNGNPLTTAAGCASLDLLPADEIDRINALGDRLARKLQDAFAAAELETKVTNVGSIVHVHLEAGEEIQTFADVNLASRLLAQLHIAALNEGVYFAPRGMLNTTTPMDEAVVDETVAAMGRAARRVAEAAPVVTQAESV